MTNRKRTKGATKRKQPLPIGRWMATVGKILVVVLVLVAAVFVGRSILNLEWQPMAVTDIEIGSTLVYQDERPLQEILNDFKGQSLLFLDMPMLTQKIKDLPWIRQVSIRKQWPGTLIVDVTEHEPVALWNQTTVLNSEGKPLEKPVAEMNLAQLYGPIGQSEVVMSHFLQFSQIYAEYGYSIIEVSMKARGSWSLKMQSGISVALGERNVLERSRRVVDVITHASLENQKIEYIDARYPNGVAVKFTELDALGVNDDIAA